MQCERSREYKVIPPSSGRAGDDVSCRESEDTDVKYFISVKENFIIIESRAFGKENVNAGR